MMFARAFLAERGSRHLAGQPVLMRPLLSAVACLCAGALQPAWAGGPKPVTFDAADGVRIAADYYAPPAGERGAPMVILLHMYKSDRKAWEPLAAPLQSAGFAVLAIDLRGHGESATTESRDAIQKRDPTIFRKMQADLRGAYDWLAKQPGVDRARLALVGASVGGSIALQYAVQDRSVDALVCLSPGLNYMELESAGDIAQIRGRKILLLATEDERDAPYTLEKRSEGAKARIYKDVQAHGTALFSKVPSVEREIVDFLRTAVGEPTTTTVCGSIDKNIYHQPDAEWAGQIAPTNLRYYSSPLEAEARGLRAAKSKGPPKGEETRDRPERRRSPGP